MSHWAYFDYAATTPYSQEVLEQYADDLNTSWGFANCGATYSPALENRQKLESARAQFAATIGADAREIVFTSGATEANNLALKGALTHHGAKQPRLITVQTEHKAVLDPAAILAKHGVAVDVLPVQRDGQIDLAALAEALKTPATLVSVMAVNNETGVIQPLAEIATMVQQAGAKLHVDAAQALGKIALDVNRYPVDMMSFSGHKIYAPKGIGALYLRRLPKMRIQAQLHGGGQERGHRSGTSPLALIRAFALAATIAEQQREKNAQKVLSFQQLLWEMLSPAFARNVPAETPHVPHIQSIATPFLSAEILAQANAAQLALSAGSACQTGDDSGSHVLRAMGLNDAARRSLRVSLSHLTTEDELAKLAIFLNGLSS